MFLGPFYIMTKRKRRIEMNLIKDHDTILSKMREERLLCSRLERQRCGGLLGNGRRS